MQLFDSLKDASIWTWYLWLWQMNIFFNEISQDFKVHARFINKSQKICLIKYNLFISFPWLSCKHFLYLLVTIKITTRSSWNTMKHYTKDEFSNFCPGNICKICSFHLLVSYLGQDVCLGEWIMLCPAIDIKWLKITR